MTRSQHEGAIPNPLNLSTDPWDEHVGQVVLLLLAISALPRINPDSQPVLFLINAFRVFFFFKICVDE